MTKAEMGWRVVAMLERAISDINKMISITSDIVSKSILLLRLNLLYLVNSLFSRELARVKVAEIPLEVLR
ncbi:MAG: hypothetical protein L7F77_07900 [Candidatus Magnetominusculus sp. LBB02]|nr:hypothetical protein [Candidatus Magnetominusculus sp. LBB02]